MATQLIFMVIQVERETVMTLYFQKNFFGGEFMVFVGLEECIKLMSNFKLIEEDIYFICKSLPG